MIWHDAWSGESRTNLTNIIMANFIEDYLQNPTAAVLEARKRLDMIDRAENINEDYIYSQISSSEFRLYVEIIF